MADENRVFSSSEYIDQVNYMGLSFPVYLDVASESYYTVIAGNYIRICGKRESYHTKIVDVVDEQMNVELQLDSDSKLVRFQNGDHLDLKLVVGNRMIWIYLISDWDKIDLNMIEDHARQQAHTYINKMKRAYAEIE